MREEIVITKNSYFDTVINSCRNEVLYFSFEEDFIEDNIRCIPMCVRFNLDACGIKLQLREWSKMTIEERNNLGVMRCVNTGDVRKYRNYLRRIIFNHTGNNATHLLIDENPLWKIVDKIPELLIERLKEFDWEISLKQWIELSNLQRFALLKLCKPGHEHKNFPKAVKEFGLV